MKGNVVCVYHRYKLNKYIDSLNVRLLVPKIMGENNLTIAVLEGWHLIQVLGQILKIYFISFTSWAVAKCLCFCYARTLRFKR